MAISYATALRTTRITDVKTAIDAGSGAALLNIYSGIRPATGAAITSEVLLAQLAFSDPCGTVSNGVLTFSAITADSSANATGTATWARITTNTPDFVADMSVGIAGSGADLILNTTAIVAGGVVSVTSASLTEGNA